MQRRPGEGVLPSVCVVRPALRLEVALGEQPALGRFLEIGHDFIEALPPGNAPRQGRDIRPDRPVLVAVDPRWQIHPDRDRHVVPGPVRRKLPGS